MPPFNPVDDTLTVVSGVLAGASLGAFLNENRPTCLLSFVKFSGSLNVNTSLFPTTFLLMSLLSSAFISLTPAAKTSGLTIEKTMSIDKINDRILFVLSMLDSFLLIINFLRSINFT